MILAGFRCKSCVNYEILMSKERKNCMCTAMLYDPKDHYEPQETKEFRKQIESVRQAAPHPRVETAASLS